MPEIDWNAPRFWYQVEYRRHLSENETFIPAFHDWIRIQVPNDRDHIIIPNTPTFTEYDYYVKAFNQQAGDGVNGEATEIATMYRGFSGEDKPTIIPSNFRILKTIGPRTAQFVWDPIMDYVVRDPNGGMRGRLAGFIIEFFRTDGSISVKSELKNHKIEGNKTTTIISNLPPYSAVRLQIAVLNDRYQGPFSTPILIYTPEGVPGPVVNLQGKPYGSSGVKLEWQEPDEPNGVITGYEIHFQQITNTAESPGLIQPPIVIRNRYDLDRIVTGLLPNKKYRFTVLATTSRGVSIDPNFVEVVTSSAEAPSKTNFQTIETFEDGFNLTWTNNNQINAASLFYVRYKRADDRAAPWLRTALTTDNFLYLNDLDRGTKYEVILVATTGMESSSFETYSDKVVLKTNGLSNIYFFLFLLVFKKKNYHHV
jgi:hypothetical protein